ncbi:hypothetical protein KC324_g33 [Hortaea werneckii]|nr:hypothetical protein KC324_g33 [Hortaea werneckii]
MRAFVHLVILGASTVSALTAAQNASAAALGAQIPSCASGGLRFKGLRVPLRPWHRTGSIYTFLLAEEFDLQRDRSSKYVACLACSSSFYEEEVLLTAIAVFAAIPPKICAVVNSTATSRGGSGVSMRPTGSWSCYDHSDWYSKQYRFSNAYCVRADEINQWCLNNVSNERDKCGESKESRVA